MQGEILSIAAICVCAALCEQLMDKNRYFRVVRMALGIEIAGAMVRIIANIADFIKI